MLTSESPWGGEEEGVHKSFQKIKIANNVLRSLVKEVICGGKNHSGKSEAVEVLTHACYNCEPLFGNYDPMPFRFK